MLKRLNRLLAFTAALFTGFGLDAQMPEGANRTAPPTAGGDKNAIVERATRRRTLQNAREAAAARAKATLQAKGGKVDPKSLGENPMAKAMAAQAAKVAAKSGKGATKTSGSALFVPGPGFQLAQPDYMFGTASNWHNTKPIHKFIDTLPGLGAENANNLGNFIPVATPKANPFDANSDYYEIGVVEYKQQLHSELAPTKLRGYQDLNAAAPVSGVTNQNSNYLGPVIIAKRDRAVRVKMVNMLPTGSAGDLFIPVDTTMMGAGVGPNGGLFSQNRAELHLHGGLNPWISDGTPHQWVTPANDTLADGVTPIPYPKGAVFQNVPDMAAGAADRDGVGTYYWTNQQSGRFMFYHDHSFGLTRLNVYAGEAAGYLIVDPVEEKLINQGILPNNLGLAKGANYYNYGIPLVIQDKTFVNTAALGTVGVAGGTDPTWDVNKYGGDGSLWYPHVYMPNQNPADISGANAMGRWDYGAWFWPPLPLAVNNNGVGLQHGAEPIVGDPNGTEIPGVPNPSLVPEAFMDTPLVNGVAYPKVKVAPKAYRFRILNAANDRFWNLSLFVADPAAPTEVVMVPSAPNAAWPATWPTDGRAGGVPDPATAGPSFIQIGNESGFLPAPVVIAPQPVSYNYNRRDIVVLNVQDKALFLGCAERADVIVDFSAYAGKTLILYNDAPAPVPAFDSRLDYYTGAPDQTTSGGAATTLAGFGPNTRTILQIEVDGTVTPDAPFDLAALNAAFTGSATAPSAFAESQHTPIVPQATYNAAMNKPLADAASLAAAGMSATPVSFANNVYVRIQDNKIRFPFPSMENGEATQPILAPKAIQELFELDYGRMNATLGVELPLTNFTNQTTIPLGYADPATETLKDGTTQYWKITHNGVDTHPVHFHLFDVQVVNRVGWDGAVRLPDANELGWKETVKMNPLEDIIVAFRPISPRLPFALPNSQRVGDVTKALHEPITWTSSANGNPVTGTNEVQDFGWEYVWHCHILGHEENDFMRPMILNVATTLPAPASLLTATLGTPARADLAWTDNATDETGFAIQRRAGGTADPFVTISTVVPNVRTYSDFTMVPGTAYDYQVIAYNQAGESAPSNIASVNTPVTVQVSGNIYTFNGVSNVPAAGVSVAFSNTSPAVTVLTDATGAYTAPVPYTWTGTITPALAGLAFTPLNRAYTNLTANQTAQDFVARPVATISGSITVGALPLAGVTVSFSNGGGTTTTDAAGAYSVVVNSGYTGTATPSLVGYSFAPASRSFTNVTADQSLQNFSATAVVVVSGTIANGATPVAGVTLTFSTGQSTTTDAAGSYTMTLASPWSGTVTPSKPNFAFTPASRTYTAISTDQATQNYAASAIVMISGVVTNGAAALPGVTITASTGQTAITDAAGSYSFTLAAPYNGTLTPALAGFIFTPANRTYAAAVVDQAAQNFSATPVISISGQVLLGAAGLPGATVTFSTGQVLTTDATGSYSVVVTSPYTGTISATMAGYFITPLSISLNGASLNQTNQNFTAVNAVRVYGAISTNAVPATPLAGVTVTFSNGAGSAVTDANGLYTHYVPSGWTGSITPALVGWAFTPTVRNFTNLTATPAGQNFTARATVTVSGHASTNGAALAGVRVAFSNGGGSAFTDAAGNYSIILNSGWTGNITASLTGYILDPSPIAVATGLTANTTQNFITVQTIAGRMRAQVNGAGTGIPGGLITYTGAMGSGTATSDVNGNFTLRVPTGWTGVVSFSKGTTIYNTWTPATLNYTNLTANVTGLRINGQ